MRRTPRPPHAPGGAAAAVQHWRRTWALLLLLLLLLQGVSTTDKPGTGCVASSLDSGFC